ncbi:hypothetical protein SRIMM317S_05824 [Streptomyces rimosus subsp. rimosus]
MASAGVRVEGRVGVAGRVGLIGSVGVAGGVGERGLADVIRSGHLLALLGFTAGLSARRAVPRDTAPGCP